MQTKKISHHHPIDAQPAPEQLPPGETALCFTAEPAVTWSRIALWSAGISCTSYVSCQLLGQPQPPCWWGHLKYRKGLDALQTLLSNNKTIPALLTQFPAQILNIAPH